MKLENQVITLEQAKRLKELGVEQRSTFYVWHSFGASPIIPMISFGWDNDDSVNPHYSAFTVAELGEILSGIHYESFGFPVMMSYSHSNQRTATIIGKWSVSFRNPKDFSNPDIKSSTEAKARGDMLIWMLENKHVTAETCNQILQNS